MVNLERKLGNNAAVMARRAMDSDPNTFGFIHITVEELAELTSPYIPHGMAVKRDVFTFRCGAWMCMIVDQKDFVEVHLIDPYDPKEVKTAYGEM